MLVRTATVDDAQEIARVHVEGWLSTYRSILPPSVFAEISIQQREIFWNERLAETRVDSVITVGCDAAGSVQGFAFGGPERSGHLGCDGELYAIYLLEQARGLGLGTELVRQMASGLRAAGCTSMAVWVLALNPYRRFYERLGGRPIAEQEIERGGQVFLEIAYGWPDISPLTSLENSSAGRLPPNG